MVTHLAGEVSILALVPVGGAGDWIPAAAGMTGVGDLGGSGGSPCASDTTGAYSGIVGGAMGA